MDPFAPPANKDAAQVELQRIDATIQQMNAQMPALQGRAIFLRGYIAGAPDVELDWSDEQPPSE